MTWTKKHDKFALTIKLSESQALVLRDAMSKGNPNKPVEIEMDLRVTNRWIGKVRPEGEYHRKTITGTIAALEEKSQGMITIMKKYSPWVYKILVRPLSFVARTKSALCAPTRNSSTGNPMFSNDHKARLDKQQQQDISKIDSLLQQVGLKYDRDALNRIWRLAGKQTENVVKAIELMVYRHQNKEIPRPHGFIVECLKHSWQEDFNIYYEPELPRFQSKSQLLEFTLLIRALGKT